MKHRKTDRSRLILTLLASTSLALLAATIIGLVYFYNRVNDYSSGGNVQINS